MRLDSLLVKKALCVTRQEAQELIAEGFVLVEGVVVKKQAKDIKEESEITLTGGRTYVSRGGNKLESALLTKFLTKESVTEALGGKTALDVGSSTGGFTDCLLSHNVSHVTAVDVGSSQLHDKLRINTRVSFFENTDIRNFTTEKKFDIIVADLSFIALDKILDSILTFGRSGTYLFLLIKPQFEVGRGNTKKGIVKDQAQVDSVVQKYKELASINNLRDVQIIKCGLQGGDGNQEYFLLATC